MLKNKLKIFIICLLISQVIISSLSAQVTQSKLTPIFNSPFSSFGIGELSDRSFIRQQALGDVSIASMDDNLFSLTNPASYSRLKSFTLETGLSTKFYEIQSQDDKFRNKDLRLSYIAIAIPIDTSLKWGFSMGLQPVSKIGYQIVNKSASTFPVSESFFAEGAYNKFYAGTSIKLFNNFYFGANAGFFFGNETYNHWLDFPDSNSIKSLRKSTKNIASGFVWDAGVIYSVPMKNNSHLQFGVTASLPAKLSAKQEILSYTSSIVNDQYYLNDTLQVLNRDVEKVSLPGNFGVGIQYKKSNTFLIATDVTYRQWSKLNYFGRSDSLNDYVSAGLGIQWSPKGGDILQRGFKNYFKLVQYRVGFKYAQTYFPSVNNGKPVDLRFTAGFGFPVGTKGSAVDLAVEVGRLAYPDKNELKEQFVKLSLGFHLFDDSWFKRRKIE